ncbi:hypothetical protein O9929_05845 [Vibrio lentus]|nr:hypothetical protein [Vibrio lentus]
MFKRWLTLSQVVFACLSQAMEIGNTERLWMKRVQPEEVVFAIARVDSDSDKVAKKAAEIEKTLKLSIG